MQNILTALIFLFSLNILALAQNRLPPDQFMVLTNQHVDGLSISYDPAAETPLSLVAYVHEGDFVLPTNQVFFAVEENARLTLPSGTPFGEGGDPFWILPQSPNPNLLYLGVNSDNLPIGLFVEAPKIILTRFEGPGYFMAWQATGPGQFNIRINTRDGVGANDVFQPAIGSHEHFNWGFSQPGVYSLTFLVRGQVQGQPSPMESKESTFVFHVRPLPVPASFDNWSKTFWPPGFLPPTGEPDGNQDEDAFSNLQEYAFHLSPLISDSITHAPSLQIVPHQNEKRATFTYRRYKAAADLTFIPQARSSLSSETWETLSQVINNVDEGEVEIITVQDTESIQAHAERYFRLKIQRNLP